MPSIYGGVERHVEELAARLVKFGHEVTTYSRHWYTKGADGLIKGVKIKHLPSVHTKHLDTISHCLLATMHALFSGADVIHYHGVGPSLVSWLPRIFSPRVKVIATFHSMDRKHEKWGWFARLMLKLGEWTACNFAHTTIAVSQTIKQYCRDVYDREAIFIPNGVPVYVKKKESNFLAEWNLQPQKYIIMLSRLIPHKGAHYLISAWQKLQKEKDERTGLPNLSIQEKKLVIVGGGYYTDKYVAALKKLAGDNANVVFTGFQHGEALAQLLSHALFMVHPSDNEGTPLTVLEAMSYGLPVLLSDIPEHKELVKNPNYLFDSGNSDELAEKLQAILKQPEKELLLEGEKNSRLTAVEYNWNDIVSRTLNMYCEDNAEMIKTRCSCQ